MNNINDREGPRRTQISTIYRTLKDWTINNPVQHLTAAFASNNYTPQLKDGDSYKGAIVVRKSNHNLYYYDKDGNLKFQSQIATGKNEGKKQKDGDLRTPTGKFKVSYYDTKGDPNYFGHNRLLRLNTPGWQGFAIHGDANQPEKIGTNASHGCIRMPNDRLVELTNMVNSSGTPVYILDENDQYKQGGKLIPRNVIK